MADGSATDSHKGQSQPPERTPKACNECRRRKIKCNGSLQCAHCARLALKCVYGVRRKMRRGGKNAATKIDDLTCRLQTLERLLRTRKGDSVEAGRDTSSKAPETVQDGSPDDQFRISSPTSEPDGGKWTENAEAMMAETGRLSMDVEGKWDYYGHSSSMVFFKQLEEIFGHRVGTNTRTKEMHSRIPTPLLFEMNLAPDISPTPIAMFLPSRKVADKLITSALDDACALESFIHRPTFDRLLTRVYATNPLEFSSEERSFVPLLYAILALGCLFTPYYWGRMDYEYATLEGSKYFDCARRMIDIADCRDIASLQTVVFLNMFLQCTARMSSCYSYVGVTITLALRMGLHRSLQTSVDPTEAEARSRIFWAIRNMEARVTSLLGLPRLLQDDDINQGMPADDTNEILDGEEPDPQSYSDVYTTAYAQLTQIMTKIVKRVYPVNHDVPGSASSKYWVSYVEVRQMERKLDDWRMALPYGLMANTAAKSPSRANYLLRIYYAHVRLILYRPFLHYISKTMTGNADRRARTFAASCINISREVIKISSEMTKRSLLVGAYWFEFYTILAAVMALVFPVLDRSHDLDISELSQDAKTGREILMRHAPSSMAANRCYQMLGPLFERADGDDQNIPQQPIVPDDNTLNISKMPVGANKQLELAPGHYIPPAQSNGSNEVGTSAVSGTPDGFCRIQTEPDAGHYSKQQYLNLARIGAGVLMGQSSSETTGPCSTSAPAAFDPVLQNQDSIPWPSFREWSQDKSSPSDHLRVHRFGTLPPYAISLPQISASSLSQSYQPAVPGAGSKLSAEQITMDPLAEDINVVDMINVGWNNVGSDISGGFF